MRTKIGGMCQGCRRKAPYYGMKCAETGVIKRQWCVLEPGGYADSVAIPIATC